MLAAKLVQLGQDRGGRHGHTVDGNRIAAFKGDFHHFGLIGRILGVGGALIDVIGGFVAGVFQHLALGRSVQKVRIDRERCLAALILGDGDLVGLGEFQQLGARGQIPEPPRRDDLDLGVERIGRQLEAHLIIALAGCAMADGIGAGHRCNLDQPLGDQGPRDRGAEQIQPLVKRIGAEHRENEIAHEFLAQIFDEDVRLRDTQHLGLGAGGFQLFALTQIGGEGHDLATIFGLQPFQDDRGVEAAGIGKNNLFRCGHGLAPSHAGMTARRYRVFGRGAR